jgi:hypothetical protein
MKKHNLITTLILAMLLQTANAQEQLCGTDKQDLTEQVNSKVFGESESKIEMEGTQATQKFTSKYTITSKSLDNHNIVPSTDANGKPRVCITLENAYRPYLNDLKTLVEKLKLQNEKSEKSCQGTYEIYQSIRAFESVFNKPSLANTKIKSEYDSLKKQYQPPDKSGVFLEIEESILGEKSDVLESKLREVLGDNKCRVEQTKCKTYGGYTLRVKSTPTNKNITKRGSIYYCKASAKIELFDNPDDVRTTSAEEEKSETKDEVTACEVAFKYLAAEIFKKIKTNIGEVCR